MYLFICLCIFVNLAAIISLLKLLVFRIPAAYHISRWNLRNKAINFDMLKRFYIPLSLILVFKTSSLRISPEVPTDFSIQLCTHQRRHIHGHMQFFPQPVRFCASMRSSKGRRELMRDLQGTTSHVATVTVIWKQITAARSCKVSFQGYQGEYRLSPDFGAYEECQFSLSRHTHSLSEMLAEGGPTEKGLQFNSSNSECPITELPSTYVDYVSCSLSANEWYILDWQSTIRYETFNDGTYGTYWANHSTAFAFQPTDQLVRNGTETEWLNRLIHIDFQKSSCDRVTLLIQFDRHWPITSTVTLTYRIREGNIKIHTRNLATLPIDRWQEYSFPLLSQRGYHEVCIHISLSGQYPIRQKTCRLVVDHLDCPFQSSCSYACFLYLSIFLTVISTLYLHTQK